MSVSKSLFRCIEVPYIVARLTHSLWPHVNKLAPIFNIQTKSDLLVAVKCMETGVFGAYANILINAKDFNGNDDKVMKALFCSNIINCFFLLMYYIMLRLIK
jgi:glutamate formiminotransferase/formiminotetrahydrofolate cyclodeaminase